METGEIIIYQIKDIETIKNIVDDAANYSILSIPFTINRMNYESNEILKRINNIFKGKIAEKVFFKYCQENNIKIETKLCETPYYQIDKRDFIYEDYEFDVKNNFYWDVENFKDYINLPALVPNRHINDQWNKREESIFQKKPAFVFTFMKHGNLENGIRNDQFVKITLNNLQIRLLLEKIKKYRGNSLEKEPNDMKFFLEYFMNIGFANFPNNLEIIITAYASKEQFNLFKNVNGHNTFKNYIDFIKPKWYEQTNYGAKFLNGVIFTKILNATCPISYLPSFKSLIK